MQSRADNLLEGFKLGSLGVSSKPKSVSTEEPQIKKEIEVIFEGTHPSESGDACPYFMWKDSDGMLYMLYLFPHYSGGPTGLYLLYLSAGEKMRLELNHKLGLIFSDQNEWNAQYKKTENFRIMRSIFERFTSFIKTNGIDVFAKQEISNFVYGFSRRSFVAWRREKVGK